VKYFKTTVFALLVALVLGLANTTNADDAKKETPKKPADPAYLQDISVTIHAGRSQGSGVIKTRDNVNYVLTAGHVVAGLRKTRQIIDPKTGTHKTLTEYDDAKIVKEIYDDDGRSVGRLTMDAEILRASDADNGDDLAILRLRKNGMFKSSAIFDKKGIESVGTDLIHVGSLLGQMGSNSLTTGVVSQTGRVLRGTLYDQSTCAAFPGSSGGGLYRKSDGVYVGMIVRGAGETFNLYVPMRRMTKWAESVGVQFIFDDSVKVPDEKTLRKTPIEDAQGSPTVNNSDYEGRSTSADNNIRFLIRIEEPPPVVNFGRLFSGSRP
jgi:hypothetical protein